MRNAMMMAAAVAMLGLSACGGGRGGVFASGKHGAPDEFAVARQAPLVIPPDFALTPPAPGAARPGNETTAEQTLKALFGGPAQRSATENQIIGSADGQRGDPGVRSNVGSPDTQVVDKGLVTRDIIFAPEGDGRDASAAIPGA